MTWKDNVLVEWSLDGSTWTKISDHGRADFNVGVTRIENKQRLGNGSMRRYVVAKKRTFQLSWSNLPDKATSFLVNGQTGQWMENFHDTVDGAFYMRVRQGAAISDGTAVETFVVMITEFSKVITKRTPGFDLWELDISLEEV
jgi:hypothetical protein